MSLLQFRVQQFRSVEDSGWITCDAVTTLVGMNEAGKSNLLLALWKLNPAQGGEINLLADMPRRIYSTARKEPETITFIETDFSITGKAAEEIKQKTYLSSDRDLDVRVSRTFDGEIHIKFLNATPTQSLTSTSLHKVLTEQIAVVQAQAAPTEELQKSKETAEASLSNALELYPSAGTPINPELLMALRSNTASWTKLPESSPFREALRQVYREVLVIEKYFGEPHLIRGVKDMVLDAIPKFVYYSNYGNLDSEIYLPHAIENMARKDLTGIAEAKARTLRVLFEYVGLDPKEIVQMGAEPTGSAYQQVTPEAAQEAAARKTERQALLHSAQSRLSREFQEWWKQGQYIFDFRADGNYFRIFVADRQRPEQIELENRSTGLQWFLSFYLVFLVESKDAHQNTILLLDEAGHSLHPLAQRDLADFFANLSKTNQVIHTTQSPFLVDTNHVDRVKVVYVDPEGFTVASENLRAAEGQSNQQRSIYAVHAALGLSISDTLLQGCFPVIVEGVSDQIYLSAIKNWLIKEKLIAPGQELLFVPSGGTKGIKPLTSILVAREGALPPVVVDSDTSGRAMQAQLAADLYKANPKNIIPVSDYTTIPDAEIEDLIPINVLDPLLNKLFRDADEIFSDQYEPTRPLVDQIEEFAAQNSITLDPGWKVTLAKQFKARMIAKSPPTIEKTASSVWQKLFKKIMTAS
ncbi:AAA family ATPase [Deinococcus sp. Marseille-Q6407]|uniref:AAA family ATPase n=1 Tax=Deinococcus sp. Marseille-Q6407 TaxID=2969223 RepID=UPI0021C02E03|nr:AAA family ATPase [Deinococcus sp. Marseille-Q6407]